MCFIAAHTRDNLFHVFPDHVLQGHGPNVVTAAAFDPVRPMGRVNEILILFPPNCLAVEEPVKYLLILKDGILNIRTVAMPMNSSSRII